MAPDKCLTGFLIRVSECFSLVLCYCKFSVFLSQRDDVITCYTYLFYISSLGIITVLFLLLVLQTNSSSSSSNSYIFSFYFHSLLTHIHRGTYILKDTNIFSQYFCRSFSYFLLYSLFLFWLHIFLLLFEDVLFIYFFSYFLAFSSSSVGTHPLLLRKVENKFNFF